MTSLLKETPPSLAELPAASISQAELLGLDMKNNLVKDQASLIRRVESVSRLQEVA